MPVIPALIGFGSGLVSAIVLMAALRGGAFLSIVLLLATPLPIMIAGLGWGVVASGMGAIVAALCLMALRLDLALGHAFVFGLPAVALTHLAYYYLNGANAEAAQDRWYPAGRLLATIAFFGGAAPLALTPLIGGSYQALAKPIGEALTVMKTRFGQQFGLDKLTAAELEALSRLMADVTPAILACYLVLIYALNLYLAGRITKASGRLLRSWPDLPGLAYPAGLAAAFGGSIVLTFLQGLPFLIGMCFAGALVMAFFLAGLAVLHAMADGQRPGRLSFLYAAFFTILGPYLIAIVAVIGLAEPLIGLRSRYPRAPKPPPAV